MGYLETVEVSLAAWVPRWDVRDQLLASTAPMTNPLYDSLTSDEKILTQPILLVFIIWGCALLIVGVRGFGKMKVEAINWYAYPTPHHSGINIESTGISSNAY